MGPAASCPLQALGGSRGRQNRRGLAGVRYSPTVCWWTALITPGQPLLGASTRTQVPSTSG